MFPDNAHPASWYQSINPVCIIVFAPFFAWIWVYLGARNLDPSAPAKMGLGLVLLGVGFLIMMWAAQLVVSSGGKVGPTWLLLAYMIHTFGELCLSPVGLSNVTKLAPAKFVSSLMGTWFLGSAIGNTVAGLVGGHSASLRADELAAPVPHHDPHRWRRRSVHSSHIARPARLDRRQKMSSSKLLRSAPALALTLSACMLASCNGPPGPKPPPKLEATAFVEQLNKDLVDSTAKRTRRAGRRPPTSPSTRSTSTRKSPSDISSTSAARPVRPGRTTRISSMPSTTRSLTLLKLGVSAPAPADAAKRAELATISTELDAMYGEGKYCPPGTNKDGRKTDCKNLDELGETIATSRNYQELTDAWAGWHTISKPMRPKYQRFVELANEGARELGYDDLGVLWRSRYDMPAKDFEKEAARLYKQVEPLYEGPALLRAQAPAAALRQRQGARRQADPGAPVRQHVGAAVEPHL